MPKREREHKQIRPDSFGAAVYHSRKRAGITLDDAGRKSGFKSGAYISLIEYSKRIPLLQRVPAIARAVGASPVALSWRWIEEFAPAVWDCLHSQDQDTPGRSIMD